MNSDNYIAFTTVCGFFIGLIIAACNIEEPLYFVGFVVLSTYCFYLMIHVVIINFIDAKKLGSRPFDKEGIEEQINLICEALNARESRIEKIRANVDEEIRLIRKQMPPKNKRASKYASN